VQERPGLFCITGHRLHPDPVFAQAAADRPTRFIRVMILPRALIGKSSIQLVNEEDKGQAAGAAVPDLRRCADRVQA
jgi:hypothetical protein